MIDGKILLSWKPPGYYASDHASEDKVCESRLHEADNKTDEGSEDEDQEAEFGDAAGPDGDNSTRATRGGAFSALLDSEDSF